MSREHGFGIDVVLRNGGVNPAMRRAIDLCCHYSLSLLRLRVPR